MTFKILTITAALGLVASGAVAQTNDWLGTTVSYSADYRASYADARRAAYDNGYRDGVKRGEQAARDRRAFQVERERDYRDADNGYNREFGDRTRYRNDYRGGFAEGYRDGYQRDGQQARAYGYGDAGTARCRTARPTATARDWTISTIGSLRMRGARTGIAAATTATTRAMDRRTPTKTTIAAVSCRATNARSANAAAACED